jgi:PPOX class probable FMN-dependent enzyme
MSQEAIGSQADLRARYGEPVLRTVERQLSRLDKHCRHFISLSPFLVLSSWGPSGADASPKGDPPGFVKVLDDTTLLLPDRRGNNRVDSLQNILENPDVGIIFFVPGVEETLRINGKARITTDPALLEPQAMKGKVPQSGLLIEVKEAFFHCGKSIIRSRLWDPEIQIERSAFPTLGKIVADQVPGRNVEEEDKVTEQVYREHLY